MNFCILKKSGDFLWKFHNLIAFPKILLNTPHAGWCAAVIFWKNPPDLQVFWLWFSPPSEKIFRNLCILKKIWRFFENSAPFLWSKATIEHAASGWCAAVIFWKRSTWFAGLLAVIFISQWKNLQEFMHSETILEIAANKNDREQVLRSHFLGPWLHCTGSPCPRAA